MKYQTHVLTLVLAGSLIGVGSFVLFQDIFIGLILILLGLIAYFYGYRVKR